MPDADTDTYLRVQLSDDPLAPRAAVRLLKRWHGLEVDDTGGLWGILSSPDPPTVDCCLATRGADDGVELYLGVAHPSDDANDDLLAQFERVCRTALPRAYGIDRVEWAPTDVLGIDTGTDTDTDDDNGDRADRSTAAVELQATAARTRDWQLPLTAYRDLVDAEGGDGARPPLAAVADTLADSPVPAVYQACLRPFRSWERDLVDRIQAIETHTDTVRDQALGALAVDWPTEDTTLPPDDRTRLAGLDERDPDHSFVCSARAVAVGTAAHPDAPATVAREVGGAFADCDGRHHRLQTTVSSATGPPGEHYRDVQARRVHDPSYESFWGRCTPGRPSSRGIVVDAGEAPGFCLLDGTRLPDAAQRGVDPTPDDRTRDPQPPTDRLARYDTGMTLGRPVDGDGATTPTTVRLPPALQTLHLALFGRTGVGKTTALIRALLDNHAATEGLDLVVAPKGDTFATDYLRAHYARFGDLDDVVYLDCSEAVPAIPFFDVRDELEAGVPRATAVQETVDHYLEILRAAMGAEQFDRAARSRDVIKHLAMAKFDPLHGTEAFSHRDLHDTMRRMADSQSPPTVSNDDLAGMLETVTDNTSRTFREIMQGVANRMETLPTDRRLARIFNHVAHPDAETTVTNSGSSTDDPDDGARPGGPASPPHFDLADLLDEDVVVVLDTGGLRSEARRVLTLVILSNLWTALRRRTQRGAGTVRDAATDGDASTGDGAGATGETGDSTETTDTAETGATAETASANADPTTTTTTDDPLVNVYLEEAATIANTDLLDTLLSRGRSFDVSVTLAMQFPGQVEQTAPQAYAELLNDVHTVLSGPVPVDSGLAERFATDDTPSHAVAPRLRALARGEWLTALPAGFGERAPQPFVLRSAPEPAMPHGPVVDDAITACAERSRQHAGLPLQTPAAADDDDDSLPPLDTALAHTRRLPTHVEYDQAARAVRCRRCDARYTPRIEGLKRAIGCCGSLDDVDRATVPICDIDLKLSDAEVRDSEWSPTQLLFCQAVYNAQQLRYSRLEYDLLADSMVCLREYVGIDPPAIDALVDAGVLRDEGGHPHQLYGVTPDGRDVIGEDYRAGTNYGHGLGDLEESSQHVLAVIVSRQWLEQSYVDDPDSPVVEAVPYYDLDQNRRLDLAGLDADGEIRVTVEAERINNDAAEAIPRDFDTMASCDPDEAIWVVMRNDAGNKIVDVLADPADGEPRVEKTYAESTPPQQFTIDRPGLTDIVPVARLLRQTDRG